jgi:hypothetical protein
MRALFVKVCLNACLEMSNDAAHLSIPSNQRLSYSRSAPLVPDVLREFLSAPGPRSFDAAP